MSGGQILPGLRAFLDAFTVPDPWMKLVVLLEPLPKRRIGSTTLWGLTGHPSPLADERALLAEAIRRYGIILLPDLWHGRS